MLLRVVLPTPSKRTLPTISACATPVKPVVLRYTPEYLGTYQHASLLSVLTHSHFCARPKSMYPIPFAVQLDTVILPHHGMPSKYIRGNRKTRKTNGISSQYIFTIHIPVTDTIHSRRLPASFLCHRSHSSCPAGLHL